eukprot:gene11068-biopygen13902
MGAQISVVGLARAWRGLRLHMAWDGTGMARVGRGMVQACIDPLTLRGLGTLVPRPVCPVPFRITKNPTVASLYLGARSAWVLQAKDPFTVGRSQMLVCGAGFLREGSWNAKKELNTAIFRLGSVIPKVAAGLMIGIAETLSPAAAGHPKNRGNRMPVAAGRQRAGKRLQLGAGAQPCSSSEGPSSHALHGMVTRSVYSWLNKGGAGWLYNVAVR